MGAQVDADQFIELYTAHEARLRGYVLSLVPRWADAEDIAQRSSLIFWKKFGEFEPGSNFFAWACQIIRFEVKSFNRRASRERMVFSDAFIDAVAEATVEGRAQLQEKVEALQKCVAKLTPAQRELLRLRYDERRSVGSVAEVLEKPLDAVYKTLSRVRQALYTCIRRELAASLT
jgi:RNA polymerase sigma-70 factor (ECF subfamily)